MFKIKTYKKHVIECKNSKIAGRISRALTRACNELSCFDEHVISSITSYFLKNKKNIITIKLNMRTVTLELYFVDEFEDILPDIEEDLLDIIYKEAEN